MDAPIEDDEDADDSDRLRPLSPVALFAPRNLVSGASDDRRPIVEGILRGPSGRGGRFLSRLHCFIGGSSMPSGVTGAVTLTEDAVEGVRVSMSLYPEASGVGSEKREGLVGIG